MGEMCPICQRKRAGDADPNKHYVTPNQSWAGAPVNDLCWASIFAEASAECYRLGYQRSQEALAAARREIEDSRRVIFMLVTQSGGEVVIGRNVILRVDDPRATIETSRDPGGDLRIRAVLGAPAADEEGKQNG